MMNREALIEQVDTWVRIAAVVASYARGDSGKGFMTPAEMSGCLQLRWFMSYGRIKIQIEHNRESSKGDYWLGGFSIGGLDPYLLVFRKIDTLTEDDMATVEATVKKLFPFIKSIRCHYCERFIVSENKEGEWFCAECLESIPSQVDKAGFVYVFGSKEKGYYKIGQSNRPDSRLSDYRASKLPFPVEMIHTIPVDDKARAEADLHGQFKHKQTNGEWFKLSPTELRKITGLKGYRSGGWVMG